MANIVLVHGGSHDGRCWSRVRPLLQAKGHKVMAVNLTGQHGGRDKDPFKITINDYVDDVITTAKQVGAPVVLIGHSNGGVVISAAAQQCPEIFERLIYLTALVAPAGEHTAYTINETQDKTPPFEIEQEPSTGSVTLSEDTIKTVFYHDCSEADQRTALGLVPASTFKPDGDNYKLHSRWPWQCTQELYRVPG